MQAILMTLRCKKCTNLHTQLLIIMKDWFQSDRAIIKLHAQAMKFRPWHIRLSLFCYMCSYHNSINVQCIPVVACPARLYPICVWDQRPSRASRPRFARPVGRVAGWQVSLHLLHVYSVPQQKAARYNIGPNFIMLSSKIQITSGKFYV